MPTTNYKIACFASSTESGCCTSDAYHAQCYDPYCSDCVVDTNSSTGYGGVFPRSCTSGANCLGCVSGGTTCPGECKCHPGSGCGCYTPGTYSPIACTGGTSPCVPTHCNCCNGSSLVSRASGFTAYITGSYFDGPFLHITSFTWSYVKAACHPGNNTVVGIHRTSDDASILSISAAAGQASGSWTGDVLAGSAAVSYDFDLYIVGESPYNGGCQLSYPAYQPS